MLTSYFHFLCITYHFNKIKKVLLFLNKSTFLLYVAYFTASLRALPTLNAGTLLSVISISFQVCGFLLFHADPSLTSILPKSIICTFTPSLSEFMTQSNSSFTVLAASFLEGSLFSATSYTKSGLFMTFISCQSKYNL